MGKSGMPKADSPKTVSVLQVATFGSVKVFPLAINFIFWILTRTAFLLFSMLKVHIKEVIQKGNEVELTKLQEWKVHHRLTCELIKRINSCFGMVVVIMIANTFGQFIYNTFQIVTNVSIKGAGFGSNYFMFTFVQKATLPGFLLYTSCLLAKEVNMKIKNMTAMVLIQ